MPSSNDIFLYVFIFVMIAFLFLNGRKKNKAIKEMKDSVKVGAQVVMAGGVTGRVAEVKQDTVVIETTPGVKIEYLKAAVNRLTPPSLDAPVAEVKKAAPKPAAKKPATKAASTAAKKPATKPATSTAKKPAAKKSAK